MRKPPGDGNVKHPNCTNVHILVAVLYYTWKDVNIAGNYVNSNWISLYYCLNVNVNKQLSQNKKLKY